ncbi:MAG: hypothetical protein R3B13_08055 [Polyangiaceae bacterium]
MSHPYRSSARGSRSTGVQVPADAWRRYRWASVLTFLARISIVIALVPALLQGNLDPLFEYSAMYLLLNFVVLPAVLYAKCPFCAHSIVRGPEQKSYWPIILFGYAPDHCTHCQAPVGATEYSPPRDERIRLPRAAKGRRRGSSRGRARRQLVDDVMLNLES